MALWKPRRDKALAAVEHLFRTYAKDRRYLLFVSKDGRSLDKQMEHINLCLDERNRLTRGAV